MGIVVTHLLDEAIAEARRMAGNADFARGLAENGVGGARFDAKAIEEARELHAKWTRIEKALVEARAKLSNG